MRVNCCCCFWPALRDALGVPLSPTHTPHNSNQEKYGGALRPPAYNFSRVTAPQVFFTGEVDLMSVPPDVAQQRVVLRGAVVGERLLSQASHMDMVWWV